MLCMYPFSINMPFYCTTIFSKIIRNRRLQPVHASMCPAGNHFLQKIPFYSNTISSNNINILYRLQTEHATMCSACTHFLQRYLFTVVLFSVRLSQIFIVYKQNLHGYALHVTIVYKYTF